MVVIPVILTPPAPVPKIKLLPPYKSIPAVPAFRRVCVAP